jgi:hypothetical protein
MAVQALVSLISSFKTLQHSDISRGCVTPKQIDNLIESSGGDTEMVDGYDDLPAEYQAKVDYALANGHVHDDDWNGVSCPASSVPNLRSCADRYRTLRPTGMATQACASPRRS